MRLLIASAALLLSLPANATWRSSQISGTPKDVDTLDAGVAIVASADPGGTMAIFAGSGAGIGQQLSFLGSFASASWRPPGCMIGLTTSAALLFSGTCNTGLTAVAGGASLSGRLRRQPNGALYVYAWRATGQVRLQRADPNAGGMLADWTVLNVPLTDFNLTDSPLATLSMPGGAEYAAFGHTSTTVAVYLDGGFARSFGTAAVVRDVALFDLAGVPAALVVTVGGGVTMQPNLGAIDAGIDLNIPSRPYATVTFGAHGGSAYGSGFGMLTVANQIYSPVPNPNAPGRDWVLRTEDAGFTGSLVRATCHSPAFCAAVTSSTGVENVFAYFNDAPPTADVRAAPVSAGGTAAYALDAGDPDGDPIWVTWIDGGFYWDGGDPRAITVIGPAPIAGVCTAPTAPPLIAVLSDGRAAHDRTIAIPVTITGSAASMPLLIASPTSLSFAAGGTAQTVSASYPPDSGCVVPALTWSIAPDGGLFGLVPGAGGVSVTPPEVFCRSTPQTFTLTAMGAADASVSVPVTLAPWGAANAPSFLPSSVDQPAGTNATYAAAASLGHACEATPNFPGTELVWIVDGGAPGVTVVPTPTSLNVFSTNACVAGSLQAVARRRVIGETRLSDDAGTLQVRLVPNWSPITSSTAFDAGFAYDPALSQLLGDFSTDANCQADRDLRAEVVVLRGDGGALSAKTNLAVPGPWFVDVPGGCSGGSFRASASLIDDAGQPQGPRASYAFVTGRIPARVPSLKTVEVPVTCGEGARGELELDLLPTDCAVQQFSWAQDRGPALTVVPDGGARVSFATASNDLQAQAGQELGWSITATVGVGNTDVASRSVKLVPAPFVVIAHRTDVPVAREEEAMGIEVILTNPTACAVSPIVLRESLGRLKPIPGSVRLNGVTLDETILGDVLEVPGLSLPALGSVRVTYLAKVPLLSAARPTGQVLLGGTDVTVTVGPQPAAGCGCGASPGSALALLALVAAVRWRRRSG